MRKVLRSGIDRRYVLFPLLVGIALVVSVYFVLEARRDVARSLTTELREREERIRLLDELINAGLAAESAQRGYLLTGNPSYLEPYATSRQDTDRLLTALIGRYEQRDQSEVAALEALKPAVAAKFQEMDRTIELARNGTADDALQLVRTDAGRNAMAQIGQSLWALRSREGTRIKERTELWNTQVAIIRYANLGSMLFTLILLVAVGLLVSHEIRRRNAATRELEREVTQRTADLRDLSEHMLRISEVEKSALARELHDELGGLLVAMRMDFSQLRRKLQMPDAASEERWARIDAGLKAGVELKRRVIEELRPTLLDNMGLVVALRWQAEQTCQQGNIQLTTDLPETEPELNNETAIAVFRTVQEALSNVLKHSRASEVRLVMTVEGGRGIVTVEDNGVGLPEGAAEQTGAHGLKQMKFRTQAIGGSCDVATAPGGRGTITTIRFNVSRSAPAQVGAWDPA